MPDNVASKLDLRELIERRYGTQAALAEELGITKGAVSHVCTGRITGRSSRYAVAAALGVHPDNIAWPEPVKDNA